MRKFPRSPTASFRSYCISTSCLAMSEMFRCSPTLSTNRISLYVVGSPRP